MYDQEQADKDLIEAYALGVAAGVDGKWRTANPYAVISNEYVQWLQGWHDAGGGRVNPDIVETLKDIVDPDTDS